MRPALFRIGASIAIAATLSGCAVVSDYWRKPTKSKDMPAQYGWAAPVTTLSLDASRRLVLSQQYPRSTDPRFTCPEPPPDVALNTLSQTVASLQTKAGTSAEAGSLFAAIAQVLSARTSSVEFWRTTSSMYCILLMNDKPLEAKAYLEAAKASIGSFKDTVVTLPVAATLPGLIGEAQQAQAEADKKKAEAEAAQKAADEKKKAAEAAAALEKAKQECAKVPEANKATDENCKKVAATTTPAK